LVALRRHVEQLRAEALAESRGDAEAATRLLTSRLLHAPSEVLRELAGAAPDEAETMETLLRRLFRLGGDEETME
jgi:glutamyl-tRNA reductase